MRDMYPQANGGPRGKLGAFADGTPGGVHKEAEMSAPAGWHPDPYGRFAKRYWDGQQWTEHVVTGDERQQVDPMGTSTAIPFAAPESAQTTRRQPDGDGGASPGHGFAATSRAVDPGGAPATAPARPDGGGFWGLLARMAPDSRTRPDPTLPIVLSGLGGVLAGGGIAALVIGDSSTRAKVVIAGVVITALCLVVRLSVPRPAEVRSAAIGGGIVGLAVLAAGIVGDGFTDNDWVPAAVIAALFLAAWALPGFFGRTVMLGIGTFAVVAAVAAAIDNDPVDPDAPRLSGDGDGPRGRWLVVHGTGPGSAGDRVRRDGRADPVRDGGRPGVLRGQQWRPADHHVDGCADHRSRRGRAGGESPGAGVVG